MNQSAVSTCFVALLSLSTWSSGDAFGHGEGVLIQKLGTRLITGSGDDAPGNQELGNRVFGNGLGSDGLSQSPSFFSLTASPLSSEPLPGGLDLYWDFLPMSVDGAVSNLFYWNAVGQVAFTPADSATLTLHDPNFTPALVDGGDAPVAGLRIGTTTGSALNLHAHRWWWLQGANGAPDEGVYLTALRVRADGYAPTEPIYFAFSTHGAPITALDASVFPWIESNFALLNPLGDYDYKGFVDGFDFLLWQREFQSNRLPLIGEGNADGNFDGVVDGADYAVWRDNFGVEGAPGGSPSETAQAVAPAPEPTALGTSLTGLVLAAASRRRSRKIPG